MRFNIIVFSFMLYAGNQCFGQKVIVKDGYAAISTDGMLSGSFEDRTNFMVNGRTPRHTYSVTAQNQKVSRLFIISPYDVDVNGNGNHSQPNSASMTWAEAVGYDKTANNLAPALEYPLANTGCVQYKGKDGNESEKGKWRLPTQFEWMLIFIFRTALPKTVGTGFVNLSSGSYWSATEGNYNQTFGGYAQIMSTINHSCYGSIKGNSGFVRCIRDY